MEYLSEKYVKLKEHISSSGSAAVAFSSGVDSTFLLYASKEALGGKVIAVTLSSNFFPARELEEAKEFCREHGIRQIITEITADEIEGFSKNPPDRCYLCKKVLFAKILRIAEAENVNDVFEGSNADDSLDYRPGFKAVQELGIKSPLMDTGFTKDEIRQLSRKLWLPTWNKPSLACLSSRIPYGETISEKKLRMIDESEQILMTLGFSQVRVRVHGKIARIEILPSEFNRFMREDIRTDINTRLKDLGFEYVTLDIQGYRTGSMNETL